MNEDQLPDLLTKFKAKGDGYTSPPLGYFTDLAEKIVTHEKERSVKQLSGARIRRIIPAVLTIAATLLLLVWFKPWESDHNLGDQTTELAVTESQLDEALASLSDEDIYEYISDNITEFELEILTDE